MPATPGREPPVSQSGAHRSPPRELCSVPLARAPFLPWRVRRHFVAAEMRRRSLERLTARLQAAGYAMVPASLPMSHAPQQNGPVWQLWANDGPVPAVVRRCMESVRHHIGMRDHRILDAHTYSDYITLPPHIEAKREVMGWTHFSDVLRVNLLAEHGGIWLDATVMLTGPVPDEMGCLPFFAFTRPEDPFLLSSWCMQSAVGSALTVALAQMLDRYWAEHDELVDYFLLHFLFEAAVTGNRRLRAQWLEVPVHSHVPPHRLQDAFAEPFDEQRLTDLLRSSWIHKLTWKPPEAARRPGTLYSQLEAAAGYWPSSA